MDYRFSHMAPEKGITYDTSFEDLSYRKMVWQWEQHILLNLTNKLFIGKQKIRYLDFACGTGRILGLLEDKVTEAVGIDISDSMLNEARRKLKKTRLINGDITRQLIFLDKEFDLVTAFRFFLNAQWELKIDALNQIRRILGDEGFLIFNIHMNKGCIYDNLSKIYCKFKGVPVSHKSMSIDDVTNLTNSAGFEIVEIYHFGVIPIWKEKAVLNYGLINHVEELFSKVTFMKSFSRYIIYLCKKRAVN